MCVCVCVFIFSHVYFCLSYFTHKLINGHAHTHTHVNI